MTVVLKRRNVLAGGTAAVLVVLAGGGYAAMRLLPGGRTADAAEADYAKLLADVHDDYVNGRVVEHQGWVLSQHEFDTIGSRQRERPVKPA